jgi:hypothetical protein
VHEREEEDKRRRRRRRGTFRRRKHHILGQARVKIVERKGERVQASKQRIWYSRKRKNLERVFCVLK